MVWNMKGVITFLVGMMITCKVAQNLERIHIVLSAINLDIHSSSMDYEVDVFMSIPFFLPQQ